MFCPNEDFFFANRAIGRWDVPVLEFHEPECYNAELILREGKRILMLLGAAQLSRHLRNACFCVGARSPYQAMPKPIGHRFQGIHRLTYDAGEKSLPPYHSACHTTASTGVYAVGVRLFVDDDGGTVRVEDGCVAAAERDGGD